MLRKLSSCFFVLQILSACGSDSGEKQVVDIKKDSIVANESSLDTANTCLGLVQQLVKKSDFKGIETEDLYVWIDDVNENVISIKITHTNEDKNDVAIAWLEFDMTKNELRDVTIDPDQPIQLHFDKKIADKIKEKCGKGK